MNALGRKSRGGILAAYVLFLVVLWGVAAALALNERSLILAAADRHLAQVTTAVAEQTLGWLRLLKVSLVMVDHWVGEHPDVDPGTSPGMKSLGTTAKGVSNNLVDIRMVTRKGGLIYTGGTASAPLADVSDREYFRAQQNSTTRGFYIARPVKSRVTGKWGIPISFPVGSAASGLGVLFGALEFDKIIPLHEAERPKPGGSISLIRTDGQFLSRVPFDESYMTKNVSGVDNFTKRMLEERDGVLHSDGSQVDGVSRIIGFARLKDFPVVVVVTALPDEILAPWRRHCFFVGAILLAVTALSGALLVRLLAALKQNELDQDVLEHQASIDSLTGLRNRRAFEEASEREFERARRTGRGLTVLMVDLDHFKDINDTLGHAVGDHALRLFGALFPKILRVNDLVGRVGGEEFCVLLPEVDSAHAVEVAERLRKEVADATEAAAELARRVTLSVGVAELGAADETLGMLFRRADNALYRAKAAGRDRVERG